MSSSICSCINYSIKTDNHQIFQETDNKILFILNCGNNELTKHDAMFIAVFHHVFLAHCPLVLLQAEIYPLTKQFPQVFDGSLTDLVFWISKIFQISTFQVCNTS